MENLIGKQFGSYQIVALVGGGGMATVYKGYQPEMDRYVAIKVLAKELAKSEEFVNRFEREAKILAKLQHPHILPVFDYGRADGYSYIVMPLIETGTLTELLKGQALSMSEINRIIGQVGDALDYAHSQGLVHRDIKPSNVLIDSRGNCLLADFGIARLFEATSKLTNTGGIIGTPTYISPEQGQGLSVDNRSDIYSLGVMLYEMATGRVPFSAETAIAIVFKHIQEPLPKPRTLNPLLSIGVEQVILKALAKRPNDRFATAGQMVQALNQAISWGGQMAVPTILDSKPTVKPQQKIWQYLVVASVVTLACLIGAFRLWDEHNQDQAISKTITEETKVDLISTSLPSPIAAASLATILPTLSPSPIPPPPTSSLIPPTHTPSPEPPTATPTITPISHLAVNVIAYEIGQGNDGWAIILINADGGNRQPLQNSSLSQRVANFSPDGNTITFRAKIDGLWQIFTMQVDGQHLRQITGPPGGNYEANYSPDGRLFAFISDRDGDKEVYVMNVDGSNPVRLTYNPGLDDDPAWSPDGQWIVFEQTRNGKTDIYKIEPDGNNLIQLTYRSDWNATPAWSPDGNWIAFVNSQSGIEHIWIMRPDGSDARQVTFSGTSNQRPAWSPDSQYLALTSNRSGSYEVWVMKVDGSSAWQLTNENGAWNPAWSRW